MPSHPKSDAEFVIAARSIALPWLDFFARQKTAPDDAANLMVAALVEVVAQQIGPFRAIDSLYSSLRPFTSTSMLVLVSSTSKTRQSLSDFMASSFFQFSQKLL